MILESQYNPREKSQVKTRKENKDEEGDELRKSIVGQKSIF